MPEDPYAYVLAAFQAPPSPDYVPGPKEPKQAPPSPVYVPYVLEPVYPEFIPPEDEVFPAEEQPLPTAASPTADSPGYVPESDPEEDLEEDDDEDPKEDPTDYPADGGDDGDGEDDSSDDDEDDDIDIEGDEEEEEHTAPADSTNVALPSVDHAPSTEETEPFETDEFAGTPPPHPAYRVTARISIRDETPISLPPREEVERLLAMPLSPWSSPLPQIPSPPLPVSSPVPVISPSPPTSPIRSLGYQVSMIRLRAEALSTSHSPPPIILSHTRSDAPPSRTPPLLPILLPTLSPPLHLLSTNYRADILEVTLPPWKRLDYGFVATMDREIMRDLERDVGYGITDTWDEMLVDMLGALVTDDTEMGIGVHMLVLLGSWRLRPGCLDRLGDDPWMRVTLRVQRRQEQFIEALRLLKRLQTQMTEFERQQGPAKGPAQPDAPEEAGSSS
ncbi:hypothetical protein Tco_0980617 [Tanacetum coccineum]